MYISIDYTLKFGGKGEESQKKAECTNCSRKHRYGNC